MKKLTIFFLAFLTVLSVFAQTEAEKEVLIDKVQPDDVYVAGEKITVTAPVKGDLVAAGGTLIMNDSIYGDLIGAGGEMTLDGYTLDDVRLAGGNITIDSEIGDDLVVFGGEIMITEKAKINGKLICFGGKVTVNGEVLGDMKVRGGAVFINGIIRGPSKIVGKDIVIESDAKFYNDVEYYNDDEELDFKNSMVDAKAQFNEELGDEEYSLLTYGTKSLKKWLIYILSAFLAILVFHGLFRNAFSSAVEGLEDRLLKSFGFGLIYLIGIPVAILIAFLLTIGIKLGLFAAAVFVFSLVFGQIVAAILIAYYLRDRKDAKWGFWPVTFVALGIAILLRLLIMIPYAGIVMAIIILSVTYGALTLQVIRARKQRIKQVS